MMNNKMENIMLHISVNKQVLHCYKIVIKFNLK